MTDQETQQEESVNPAENTEPPGNPEPDPERVEQGSEELEKAGAN
jgi:hypothetical protein